MDFTSLDTFREKVDGIEKKVLHSTVSKAAKEYIQRYVTDGLYQEDNNEAFFRKVERDTDQLRRAYRKNNRVARPTGGPATDTLERWARGDGDTDFVITTYYWLHVFAKDTSFAESIDKVISLYRTASSDSDYSRIDQKQVSVVSDPADNKVVDKAVYDARLDRQRYGLSIAVLVSVLALGIGLWHFFTPSSEKQLVREIQVELVRLGYKGVTLSGELDAVSEGAIKAFEYGKKLRVFGEPTDELLTVMRLAKSWPGIIPGERFRDCENCPEMIVVPPGEFLLEKANNVISTDEYLPDIGNGKSLSVQVKEPLAVGLHEITFSQWDDCVADGGCGGYIPVDEGWGRGNRPVINVNWTDAQNYIAWLSAKTGEKYRLLNAQEWVFVAGKGAESLYIFDSWLPEVCEYGNFYQQTPYVSARDINCSKLFMGKTAPVASFRANNFGVYDMHGNVWEWVETASPMSFIIFADEDDEQSSYKCHDIRPMEGVKGMMEHQAKWQCRFLFGGSWGITPKKVTVDGRLLEDVAVRSKEIGFRVARSLQP